MSLTRAVDYSERGRNREVSGVVTSESNNASPGNGGQAVDEDSSANGLVDVSRDFKHPHFIIDEAKDDDDSSVSSSEEENPTAAKASGAANDTANIDSENHLEMICLGGLPYSIPDKILHKCFAYLPIDDHAPVSVIEVRALMLLFFYHCI